MWSAAMNLPCQKPIFEWMLIQPSLNKSKSELHIVLFLVYISVWVPNLNQPMCHNLFWTPSNFNPRHRSPLSLALRSRRRSWGGNPVLSQKAIEISSSVKACLMPSANLSASMALRNLKASLLEGCCHCHLSQGHPSHMISTYILFGKHFDCLAF